MERRYFLKWLAGGVIMGSTGIAVKSIGDSFGLKPDGNRMPALFIGHGSPMNAIADNEFTRTLNALGKKIPTPKLILCVSAHWMTEGTWITHMDRPKTIHDFYGFPQALFDVQYPAPGNKAMSELIKTELTKSHEHIHLDHEMWGFDHGTWSILRHLYPKADVPVAQLSLYLQKTPDYHFHLGQSLSQLRDQGVLLVGSGNIVHNLRRIQWEEKAKPYDWALEFDQWVKEKTLKKDFTALQNDVLKTEAGKLSVPTPDHYLPLLYILGAARADEEVKFDYEEMQNASISMRCLSFGMPA